MMQHTQTHNHTRNKKKREKFTEEVISKDNRKQQRALPPPPLQTSMLTPPHLHQKLLTEKQQPQVVSWHSLTELPISPVSPTYQQWSTGAMHSPHTTSSPVSLLTSPTSSAADDEPLSPSTADRRLSVAELCNPVDEQPTAHSLFLPLEERISLTKDEYEALQGFTRFQQVWVPNIHPHPICK